MRTIIRAGLAGLMLTVGCSGSPSDSSNPDGTAEIRLLNAAIGSAPLDLMVDGQVLLTGVEYQHRSGLVTVPAGSRSLALRAMGQSAVLLTRQVTLTDGAHYTAIASGVGAALSLTSSVTVDTGLAKPDRANLRIINIGAYSLPVDSASLPAPIPLNVIITAPGVPLAGAPSQLSLDARFSSYSSLIYFDPGSYVVRFVRPGSLEVVAETAVMTVGTGQVRAITLQRLADGSYATSVIAEE